MQRCCPHSIDVAASTHMYVVNIVHHAANIPAAFGKQQIHMQGKPNKAICSWHYHTKLACKHFACTVAMWAEISTKNKIHTRSNVGKLPRVPTDIRPANGTQRCPKVYDKCPLVAASWTWCFMQHLSMLVSLLQQPRPKVVLVHCLDDGLKHDVPAEILTSW